MNATTASCQAASPPLSDSIATTPTLAARTTSTTNRIRFCDIRSASAPPSSVVSSIPIADAPATSESSAAPPPIATICQTNATIQMPVPISDDTSAAASQR